MANALSRPSRPSRFAPSRWAAFEALSEPRFRRLWFAGLFINTARWVDFLVFPWIVLEITGSPLLVGLAAFCRWTPMMLFGPFSGVIADRLDRGRVMRSAQVLYIVAALGLAGLFASGQRDLLPLFFFDTLLGLAYALDHPTRRTTVYTLVGARRLTNAISLETVSMQGSKMTGPLLGGLLLPHIGPAGCYGLLVAFFLIALALTISLTRGLKLPRVGSAESILASLVSGFREARREPTIQGVLVVTAIMNLLIFPYQSMLSVFAKEVLHVGPELLGLLLTVDGLGSMAMALTIASRRDLSRGRQLFAVGSMIAALLVCGLAASPLYALSLVIQLFLGMAESCFGTLQSALVMLAAPERLRGRAVGLISMCIGTGPIGSLLIGWGASQLGAPPATMLAAASGFLLMLPWTSRMFRAGRLEAALARG